MKELEDWFARQAKRESRVVHLDDALLSNRFHAYAGYRLRYFFVRYAADAVVHGIKFLFLLAIFSQRTAALLLLAHTIASFASSFWWGALEVMRARVRHLARSGKPHLIPSEIGHWMTLAVTLSVVTLLGSLGWLTLDLWRQQPFTPAHLYVYNLLLWLAAEWMVRALHSGVYAIRRIYRPVWAIVGIELVGFLSVLAMWPAVGPWSLPFGTLISTIAIVAVTTRYTLQAYRFLGFLPLRLFNFPQLGQRLSVGARELLGAGLSYALMRMDSILVLALFRGGATPGDAVPLFMLFFVIGPTVRAGFDWAQLFYFDLKRLELRVFANVRRRYERSIAGMSWLMAGLFWGLACLTITVIWRRSFGGLYWFLLPFFLSRSLLAWAQVKAFAQRHYWNLCVSAGAWLLAALAATVLLTDGRARLAALSLITFAALALLKSLQGGGQIEGRDVVGLTEWLHQVNRAQGRIRIGCLELAPRDLATVGDSPMQGERWAVRQVATRIARRLNGLGAVTIVSSRRIAWYERGKRPERIGDLWLARATGGLMQAIARTGLSQNGPAAIERACSGDVLGPELSRTLKRRNGTVSADTVAQAFLRAFPSGVLYSPEQPAEPFFDALPSREKRKILKEAVRFSSQDQRPPAHSAFDVTAFCVAGELRLIFVVDQRANRAARARWRSFVRRLNLQAALAPTG